MLAILDFQMAQNLIVHILSWVLIYDKNFKLIAQTVLKIMRAKGSGRTEPRIHGKPDYYRAAADGGALIISVSYTHLTLPTKA